MDEHGHIIRAGVLVLEWCGSRLIPIFIVIFLFLFLAWRWGTNNLDRQHPLKGMMDFIFRVSFSLFPAWHFPLSLLEGLFYSHAPFHLFSSLPILHRLVHATSSLYMYLGYDLYHLGFIPFSFTSQSLSFDRLVGSCLYGKF